MSIERQRKLSTRTSERINQLVAGTTIAALGVLAMFSGSASAQEAPAQIEQTEFAQHGGEAGQGGVTRYSGETRVDTAINISQNRFSVGEANSVFIIHEAGHDALAAAPASAAYSGPMLYTQTDNLPEATQTEMLRALGDPRENVEQVYIIGGTAVISEETEQSIEDLGYTTHRIAGETRIETAIDIAEQLILNQTSIGTPSMFAGDVYESPQDAALAGMAASRFHLGDAPNGYGVVLPVNGDQLSESAIRFYNENIDKIDAVYSIGANAVHALNNTRGGEVNDEEIVGENDTETSVMLAERFNNGDGYTPGIALASTVADTLTATAHAVGYQPGTKNPAWLMYTHSDTLSPSIRAYIEERQNTPFAITDGYVYGGERAISSDVSTELSELLAQ